MLMRIYGVTREICCRRGRLCCRNLTCSDEVPDRTILKDTNEMR